MLYHLYPYQNLWPHLSLLKAYPNLVKVAENQCCELAFRCLYNVLSVIGGVWQQKVVR